MLKLFLSVLTLTPILWKLYHDKKSTKQQKYHKNQTYNYTNTEIQVCPNALKIYFHGNNWNIAYQLGIASALKEFLDFEYLQFYGSSFGSIISTALHLELSLEELFYFIKTAMSQYHGIYFIWNFHKMYSNFIDSYCNRIGYPPPTYVFTSCSLTKSKWMEISPPNYKDILKYTYLLPFPNCIPKNINNHGVVINNWKKTTTFEIEVSTDMNSIIPPPMQLQYKNIYSCSSMDELFTVGYLKAYIALHTQSLWIPYFKNPPQHKNILKCKSYLQEIDTLMERVI